jgi:hypothetical protein
MLRVFRSRRNLLLENLVLRQQLAVLKRKRPRPRIAALNKPSGSLREGSGQVGNRLRNLCEHRCYFTRIFRKANGCQVQKKSCPARALDTRDDMAYLSLTDLTSPSRWTSFSSIGRLVALTPS